MANQSADILTRLEHRGDEHLGLPVATSTRDGYMAKSDKSFLDYLRAQQSAASSDDTLVTREEWSEHLSIAHGTELTAAQVMTLLGAPGGSDGQVLYNNGGVFGGDAALLFDDVNKLLALVRASGPTYVRFEETGLGSQGAVGLLGSNEVNLSCNMDYATRVHRLYNTAKAASWLGLNPTNWAIQYAPATEAAGDVWTAAGSLYSICGVNASQKVMFGYDLAKLTAADFDARVTINRAVAQASLSGYTDFVLDGHRTKGTAGIVYLNPYNAGIVSLCLGGGKVLVGTTLSDTPASQITLPGAGKIGWEASANTNDVEVGRDKANSLSAAAGDQIWADNLVANAQGQVIDLLKYAIPTAAANVKGLWFFDRTGAVTTITDRSDAAHTMDLSANASTLAPSVTGLARHLTIAGPTSYYDTVDHADFSITTEALTLVWAGILTDASSITFLGKLDLTTGSVKAEYMWFCDPSDKMYFRLYNNGAATVYIGRSYNTALTADQGSLHVYHATVAAGGTTNAAVKLYRDGVQVDDTNQGAGSFVAPIDTAAKLGSYYLAADGTTKTYPMKGAVMLAEVIKGEEWSAAQVKRSAQRLLWWGNNGAA